MADPNRKINLEFPDEEEPTTSDESDHVEFDPEEITLVKDFEEDFKDRFTDKDEIFTEFCKRELKPPPIVFPYDNFQHHQGHHRGGGRGGYRNHQGNNWRGNQRFNNSQHHHNRSNNHRYSDQRQNYNSYQNHHQSSSGTYGEHKRRRFND